MLISYKLLDIGDFIKIDNTYGCVLKINNESILVLILTKDGFKRKSYYGFPFEILSFKDRFNTIQIITVGD